MFHSERTPRLAKNVTSCDLKPDRPNWRRLKDSTTNQANMGNAQSAQGDPQAYPKGVEYNEVRVI